MRLLVIDDSPLDRALVAEMARVHGVEAIEVETGREALQVAATCDVILLDGHLPGEDIPGVAANLRVTAPDARIFLWSGYPDDIVPELGDGDVDGVVSKPSDLDGLEDALLGVLLPRAA